MAYKQKTPVRLANGYVKVYNDSPLCESDFMEVPKMYFCSYWLGKVFYECHASDYKELSPVVDRVRELGAQVTTWVVCKQDSHLPQYIKLPF